MRTRIQNGQASLMFIYDVTSKIIFQIGTTREKTAYILYMLFILYTIYYSPSPYTFTGKKTECFQIDLLKGGALFNNRAQTI